MSQSSSSRLARQWPELEEAITALAASGRSVFALAVAEAAVNASALDDVTVLDALTRARAGGFPEPELLAELGEVIERLDDAAWTISDAVDGGGADYSDYEAEFAKARAANSLWFAMNPAEPHFAHEAAYEAIAANTGLSVIGALMRDGLRPFS